MPTPDQWIECKGLPLAKCNAYRANRGLPPLESSKIPSAPQAQTEQRAQTSGGSNGDWNPSKPCRGLGDVVAKVAHATGLDRLVPKGCGCAKRQEALNQLVPFKGPE